MSLRIGAYTISQIVPDLLRLDGGSMFGSVPKTLWQRKITPDEQNRILLASRCLLVEGEGRKILVDVGNGRTWGEKEQSIYGIEYKSYPMELLVKGVTDIILTHLHFDHAAGISHINAKGELELSFPDATIHLQRANWENANEPNVRERASYLPSIVEPLKSANLNLIDGNVELLPGIAVERYNGHTSGLQGVFFAADGEVVAFPSDLIPTSHHLSLPYIMGYDMCAETTLAEKEQFLARAEKGSWNVVFQHDVEVTAGRIGRDEKGRYVLIERLDIPEIQS